MAAKTCPICGQVVEQNAKGTTQCPKCNHWFKPSD